MTIAITSICMDVRKVLGVCMAGVLCVCVHGRYGCNVYVDLISNNIGSELKLRIFGYGNQL